ncbi:GNAT family N-acetyltransferase [Veronia nyctiphanis]|uniref:GNAT family N-acetyltransferase n=1 Tax=Veronia nyctiphanis TaxID=1278244 RepID=A0A4V1LSX4_9GAMM|nr:GNAT family N-acetyltransferase [Veronia nyctiphanis]RXJ73208.1 GNAT family N-acetyltransferase [Veronia nyctiphanis]
MLEYLTRQALDGDYDFLFELKKAAEYDAVKAVFGWDENIQREIHADEWEEARPNIIEVDGNRVGSFLLLDKGDHFYFCRFFLMPKLQGKGLGSRVLNDCLRQADDERKPVRLCYLQGHHVGKLYHKFGFSRCSEDAQFVYMERT